MSFLGSLAFTLTATRVPSAGVQEKEQDSIVEAIGVRKGDLTSNMWVFPLMLKGLASMIASLLWIRLPILHWAIRKLSMAGRVQIINNVIHVMHTY